MTSEPIPTWFLALVVVRNATAFWSSMRRSTASPDGARVRVIFTAKPTDDTPPLSSPNEHSLEARWVTLEELEDLPLRGKEVRELFASVADGESIYPVSLLGSEARS